MRVHDDILETVADRVGTPAYVYDADALRGGVANLKAALPDAEFIYSLKANPNASIVSLLTSQGIGAEVCSLVEIETCLRAGVPAEEILFVGPAKSKAELNRAIEIGVKAIVAESLQELALINSIAGQRDVCQAVALRINPQVHIPGARLAMAGKPTQFGIDEGLLEQAVSDVAKSKNLSLRGLHVYMGTRILDYNVVVENSRVALALADRIAQLAGHPLDFVDIGGGFGVAYHAHEADLDLGLLGQTLSPILAEARQKTPQTRIVIELGRYMVAHAGSFLTRVRFTKRSKGKQFAICDGGSNCHTAAGQSALYRKNFPIRKVGETAGPKDHWEISGPLCTPTDIIASNLEISALQAGDLVCIDRSGAYGPTASPVNFLSFGMPFEVMVDGNTITVIRERQSMAELLNAQVPRQLAETENDSRTKETI